MPRSISNLVIHSPRGLAVCLFACLAWLIATAGHAAPPASGESAAAGEAAATSPTLPAAATRPVEFTRDVYPLLVQHCVACHGPDEQEGRLRLDARAPAFFGGVSGKSIVQGESANSLLMHRLAGLGDDARMPLDADPLTAEEIGLIRAWIDSGAKWPDGVGPDVAAPKPHWAYIAPRRPALPAVKDAAWPRNPIDHFVLARLERERLRPSPEVDRARLIRRVYLDLIGLPPTVEEVAAFEADTNPAAYERVVDRLLARPAFGERWARPWLDLARYADSNGYQADQYREIWPYRDWVINALNADMPYDRFTIEQLAGDLLPNATVEQRVATGFHRCTTCNVEAGVDPEENRVNQIVDRVNTTATVWLGSTLECAQCHHHKYDPFTQWDYYRLFAFFNNTPLEVKHTTATTFDFFGPKMNLLTGQEVDAKAAKAPTTLVMIEMDSPRMTHLLKRGNFLTPGAAVSPGTPNALPAAEEELPPNRLGLARWITRPDHPLTARVAVNRWWAELFGRGIVATTEDFGTQGEPPTHPELLDWLAVEFVDGGWSPKAILKQIVMSATYRQSSRITPELLERDPENKLLARMSRLRLSAESIRDNALAASGLLSDKMAGPPIYPPQPAGVWRFAGRNAPKYDVSKGEDRFRRGIYVIWRRSAPYVSFVNFDAPDRASCTIQRPRTNTPLQALTLLNDPAFIETAHALAHRVLRERAGASDAEKLEYAFRLCVARSPSEQERTLLADLLNGERSQLNKDAKQVAVTVGKQDLPKDILPAEFAAWCIVANVLLNLDETITRN